jgi:hypothetical protein
MSVDDLTESVARGFAQRFTRRSAIGRFGGALAVLGAGGLVAAETAQAACGCSKSGYSTQCAGSTCPSGTCECGHWSTCTCAGALRFYKDCCGGCSGGCSCGSDGYPRCYYQPPYGSCGSTTKVHCRLIYCTKYLC